MVRQHGFRATGPQRPSLVQRYSVGAIAAAGLIIATTPSEASPGFWDFNTAYYGHEPAPAPAPRHKRRVKSYPKADAKLDKQQKEATKPQGPLVIAVSIERQTVKVYDANGLFAESPVSTGMRGHSTPMGVFSVIQKSKFHRSNLYSGAPMPFMQRITWSGVAMHAGVLPGYPASHGCIRMPMSFAQKMWGWTRMGARVVITPGEVAPETFTHPLLFAQKPAPQQSTAVQPEPASEATTGKVTTASADAQLELRPALIPHSDAGSTSTPSPVRTADAGASASDTPTASDAGSLPAASDSKPAAAEAEKKAEPPTTDAKADSKSEPKTDTAAEAKPTDVKPGDAKPVDAKPTDAKATDAKATDAKPADIKAGDTKATDAKSSDTKPDDAKPDAAKPDSAAAAPKRSGQIAAFVSRKDSKLYVRQNFAPLFDVPVEIAASDRPLGTHIFTARLDKDNPNAVSWSVVSLPAVTRRAAAHDDDRASRRHKSVGAVEVSGTPQPLSAAEALDRLKIPADAMTRIAEALSTGGSLIVSDQGIASGETGEGTDFIIPLRPLP